jgi:ribosomal protein S18 acetylase RimI-like enzyme
VALVIRPAVEADLQACADLYERVVRETFFWFDRDELTADPFWAAVPDEELTVAELDGGLVAILSLYRPDAFLHSLYVDEDARGLGIGSALFAHARSQLGPSLSLKVQKRNTGAIAFYERRGLVFAGEGDQHMPGGGWYLMREQS